MGCSQFVFIIWAVGQSKTICCWRRTQDLYESHWRIRVIFNSFPKIWAKISRVGRGFHFYGTIYAWSNIKLISSGGNVNFKSIPTICSICLGSSHNWFWICTLTTLKSKCFNFIASQVCCACKVFLHFKRPFNCNQTASF